ncbi:MAG: hypothetical protein K2O18_13340 [Oscillospiraceae bacterium]|nr:hypothetical protein [Oscillospiraceae bacterium]
MNQTVPVAGVDVSKRFSDMCVLAPNNDILARMKIYHDLTSLRVESSFYNLSEKVMRSQKNNYFRTRLLVRFPLNWLYRLLSGSVLMLLNTPIIDLDRTRTLSRV